MELGRTVFPPANADPAGWLILLQDKQQSATGGGKMHEQSPFFFGMLISVFPCSRGGQLLCERQREGALPKTVAPCVLFCINALVMEEFYGWM